MHITFDGVLYSKFYGTFTVCGSQGHCVLSSFRMDAPEVSSRPHKANKSLYCSRNRDEWSIVERLCSDLDRKEPRYKSPTLLYFLLSTRLYSSNYILLRDMVELQQVEDSGRASSAECITKGSRCIGVVASAD